MPVLFNRMEVTLQSLDNFYEDGKRIFTKDKIYEGYNDETCFDKPFEECNHYARLYVIDDVGTLSYMSKKLIEETFNVLDTKIIPKNRIE